MYTGQAYSSPEEALAHYGVKGMRWGVRKKDDIPMHPDYTKRMQKNDAGSFLLNKKGAVKRINRDMVENDMTRKKAFEAEYARRAKIKGTVASTAYLGWKAYQISTFINKDAVAYGIGKRAETKRGERRAKEYLKSRGLPQQTRKPKEKYTKPGRGGTFKITDL